MRTIVKKIAIVISSMFLLLFINNQGVLYANELDFTKEELDYINENPIVITAVDPLFHPYEFIDKDGVYKGMAADYLKLFEIRTGLTFEVLEGLTWPEAYDMALNGQVDLLPCIGITNERQKFFNFTDPYFQYQRAIFSLDGTPFHSFKDLKNITVGVQRNSSHYSYLKYEKDIDPVLYNDNESLLLALSKGEVDIIISNYASTKYSAGQLGILNIKADEIIDNENSELGMAIRKDKPILASILNKSLSSISEEEKILIRNKWLGIESKADYSKIYKYIFISLPIVLGIILIFFLWNRSLKKQQEETKKALEKVKTLFKASSALRSTTNLNQVMKIILSGLKEVVPFDTATIQEFKNGEFKIIYCEGFKNIKKKIGIKFANNENTIFHNVVNTKLSVIIPDVRKHNEFIDLTEENKIRSSMVVPLIINNKVIGELTLDSFELNFYDSEKATTAEAFAAQASLALNNAETFEALKKSNAAAEHAARVKGDFLANMSHEIRTPMNAVLGMITLLEYTELEKKQKDYVKKIERAAKNLLKIINDILDFSKIESGKLEIESIEFFLDNVLNDLSDMLSMKAATVGIDFIISKEVDVPDGLIGDPFRLEQILVNLTNNAIKFTEKGEVIIKINVEKRTKKEVILKFSVKDTGIGMTKEQISKLFKAFTQADTSTTRKYGGSGLGLSISKNLVELMGGKISAQSQYGKGSEFFFTCPFKLSGVAQPRKEIKPTKLKKIGILIVEKNEYSKEIIEKYLHSFGFNTTMVSSSEEAITETSNNSFDLIILNYKIPDQNGIDTYKKIKEKSTNIPKAILVSAYPTQELLTEAVSEGIYDVLTKPFTQSTLYDAIINILFNDNLIKKDIEEAINYPNGFEKIRGAQILVVEDNELNQQVIKELLEIEGFWVDLANNGQESINKIIESNHYDLIFMDLQMPIMDGYSASEKLRNQYNVKTPIIALSADVMEEIEIDTKKAGMNGHIAKPINKQELFQIMVKYIKPLIREKKEIKNKVKSLISIEMLNNNLKNFDIKDGLTRLDNDIELYVNILSKYSKNNSNFVSELKKLINEKDLNNCLLLLHKMKGVTGNIGAINLNQMITKLEQKIKNNNFEFDYEKDVIEIDNESTLIITQIKDIIEMSENNDILNIRKETINKKDIIIKLKKLLVALTEYDTKAKQYYEDFKNFNLEPYTMNYINLGKHIEDYNFELAAKVCVEIINKLEKGVP